MSKFFKELKRRNVIKETLAYLVVSWVLLQVATIILPIVNAPDWVLKTVTFFLAIGLPIWIFFSWAYQVTPKGIKRTAKFSEDQTLTTATNKRLNIIILITLLIAIGVSFINKSQPKVSSNTLTSITEKSIAVLPFDDYSSGGDTEWFCNGVTEDIRTNLSKIKGIKKVISHTSVEKFKNSDKTIPEIAKELGVSYILEGNVRKHKDKIIITAKLIDANDNQIWAENYSDNFDKVFEIQNDVSKKIVKQLKIVISPEEEKVLNIQIIDNFKAYELYLRGRHLWNQQNTESIKRSIEYLEESIKLDSTFAPAYVILAEDYILMNKFIPNNEEKLIHRKKCREAIDKAIELDNSLAEAYITKGNMIGKFDWDWEEMKKMLEKGLQIEPNNSYGHMLLSKYYLIKNNYNKAIEEALLAEKLDPLNPRIGCFVAKNYFIANNYKRSIDQYEKVLKLSPNYVFAWEGVGHVQYFSGQKETAQISWGKFLGDMGNEKMADIYSNESFDNSISYWLEGATKGEELYCSNPTVIAQAHMFIDKKQGALEYLEVAYKYHNEDLPIYLLEPHFYSLYNEPRFKDIVQKTGVILPDVKQEFEIID